MRFYIYLVIGFSFICGCASSAKYTRPVSYPTLTHIEKIDYSKRFIWPVNGRVVALFGSVNADRVNKGIDIKTQMQEEVRASSDGQVVFCGDIRGFGLTIIIRHAYNMYTLYSNNAKVFVKNQQDVRKGDIISLVGIDPWSKESVLHFEVRKNNNPIDPLSVLN